MNKEYLEAFKIVYNNFDYLISDVCIENDDVNICLKTIKEQLPTIKQALQRLESIEKGKNTDIIDNYMAFKNDNSNPSEALECLERLDTMDFHRSIETYIPEIDSDISETQYLGNTDEFYTIKQALLKAQEQKKLFDDMLVFKNGCLSSCFEYKGKQIVAMPLEEYAEFMEQEKVLETIKEKEVNMQVFNQCEDVETYNKVYIKQKDRQLTKEEFEMLKEVL